MKTDKNDFQSIDFYIYNKKQNKNILQKCEIVGIIIRHGESVRSGHYMCYYKFMNNKIWYFYNDMLGKAEQRIKFNQTDLNEIYNNSTSIYFQKIDQ